MVIDVIIIVVVVEKVLMFQLIFLKEISALCSVSQSSIDVRKLLQQAITIKACYKIGPWESRYEI